MLQGVNTAFKNIASGRAVYHYYGNGLWLLLIVIVVSADSTCSISSYRASSSLSSAACLLSIAPRSRASSCLTR